MMNYDVFLEEAEDKSYIARILAWPNSAPIKAATREEALAQARTTIIEELAQGQVVRFEIKPEELDHPWLKFAGMWADDPSFDDFRAEIERYRRELDAELEAQYEAEYDHLLKTRQVFLSFRRRRNLAFTDQTRFLLRRNDKKMA